MGEETKVKMGLMHWDLSCRVEKPDCEKPISAPNTKSTRIKQREHHQRELRYGCSQHADIKTFQMTIYENVFKKKWNALGIQ